MKKLLFHYILIFQLFLSVNCFAKTSLKFIKDFNFDTGTKFENIELGGLSGLFFDSKNGLLYAISDDKSEFSPARIHEFKIDLDKGQLIHSKVITLKTKLKENFKKYEIDAEGISKIGKEFIITSEGQFDNLPFIQPQIFRFSEDGDYIGELTIPKDFKRETMEGKSGVRKNLVFEALSSVADKNLIAVGMEGPLLQDGNPSTRLQSGLNRILFFKNNKLVSQIPYRLEKLEEHGIDDVDLGLVDIVLFSPKHFYSLERAFYFNKKINSIKIFENFITKKTTKIKQGEALEKSQSAVHTPKKNLLLNLDTIISNLDPLNQKLDNIEGITMGPKLKNGHDSLIVVSDNNFSKHQRTVFMVFEIIKNR